MPAQAIHRILEADVADVARRELPWHRLSGARVVVTGVGGFLGGHMARALLGLHRLRKVERPVRVEGWVRNPARAQSRLADVLADGNFSLREWDLTRIAVPEGDAPDYLVHAASLASPRFFGTDPVGTLLPNTVGTAALLEWLRRSGACKGFLFVSSSEVYGAVGGEGVLDESGYGQVDPASVRASYAESKRMGETMCVAWHHQHGIPAFIVRPFHTYGPGLQPDDGRVFADFAFNVARGENIAMNSDGSARRAYCYASDAVAGFLTVLLQGAPARPYNVANPAGELSVLELAEMLTGLFPDKALRVDRRMPAAGYMPSSYNRLVPDVSRLAALGWRAEVDPASGFRRMIEACQP
jgi:UDP-glucuronate decarboxylase